MILHTGDLLQFVAKALKADMAVREAEKQKHKLLWQNLYKQKENPAYGRHQLSRQMRIVAPIP